MVQASISGCILQYETKSFPKIEPISQQISFEAMKAWGHHDLRRYLSTLTSSKMCILTAGA